MVTYTLLEVEGTGKELSRRILFEVGRDKKVDKKLFQSFIRKNVSRSVGVSVF